MILQTCNSLDQSPPVPQIQDISLNFKKRVPSAKDWKCQEFQITSKDMFPRYEANKWGGHVLCILFSLSDLPFVALERALLNEWEF